MIDATALPVVPPNVKRTLPHDGSMTEVDLDVARGKGWVTLDVRLLPSDTMEERQRAVLAWLEGVRLGSVTAESGQGRVVEAEMRACGLFTGKLLAAEDTSAARLSEDTETLEEILRLGVK